MKVDSVLVELADYVLREEVSTEEAIENAKLALMDSLGCAMLALQYRECTKLLGPVVSGTKVEHGSVVPGTSYTLDPIQAAFNIGTMIRWLDYNDCWLAKEWGHPSDNFGGILAVADFVSRRNRARGEAPFQMKHVLEAAVKAYEIQGVLALNNSLNRVGFDHVLFVKIASTAVITQLLGGTKEQIINALSNAWIDTGSLRTYRHYPNAGSRKSWAAGDATSRAVWLANISLRGEMGYITPLSASKWGFEEVIMGGNKITLTQPLEDYVMKQILFKISFPAEFHAQTAAECALYLHPKVKHRLDDIAEIVIDTHESAIRIIDKTGPLHNPADRDHCLQYIVAIGLVYGEITANHYEDHIASNPMIDTLRKKMKVKENERYSIDYLDPQKRSIANAVQIFFKDGTATEKAEVEYPVGHRFRREEGKPLLYKKFEDNISHIFKDDSANQLLGLFYQDTTDLMKMDVDHFMDMWRIK